MNLADDDQQWLLDLLQRVEDRLGQRVEQVELSLKERIERVETNLLAEFHKWASPAELRSRSHSFALRALDLELETLKERVEKLEGEAPPS